LLEVVVLESSNSLANFVENFNSVNDEGLGDGVDERSGVSESFSELNELLDVSLSSLAVLGSLGDDLNSLSDKLDTLLDLFGVLGLD